MAENKAAKNTALAHSAKGIVDRNKSLGVGKKPVIKVNSNPNKTPAKTSKTPAGQKIDWGQHAFESREGTDEYGRSTFNNKGKIKPIKVNSNPVKTSGLQGRGVGAMDHMGGHGGISGVGLGGGAAHEQTR